MKFEGVDIYGFKSFADKVSITFDKGMTGIVGPNGCGKSNVVDAIRWVLGEQSPKILRGKSMQDVIFNGTERRKSISFCEVSLKFNNKEPEKIFKTLNFDQVIISRKLSKDGISQYLINGTPAKLRDIKALIRETGLGREGYSIVGQGKIDEIINSKPESRRAIFEDAAGVSTSKIAKKEAERNLADYEIRKEQYESLLAESQRTVARLEKEAEVAKKAVEIQNQLMSLEANSYIYQKENNGALKEKIKEDLLVIVDKIIKVDENLKAYTRELEQLSIERSELNATLTRLYDERQELSVKAENIKGAGNTLLATQEGYLRTKDDYKKRLIELEEEFDLNNSNLRDLYAKESMDKEEIDELVKKQAVKLSIQSQLFEEILEREKQIEAKNSEVNSLLDSIGSIKENIGKIEGEKQSLLEQIAEIVSELDKKQEESNKDEEDRAQQEHILNKAKRDLDRLIQSRDNIKREANELLEELEKLKEKGHALDKDKTTFTEKVNMYQRMVEQFSGFNGSVQELLKAKSYDSEVDKRVLGVVANVIKVDSKYQAAIENALGASMQHIIVADEEDGKYLINYLRENRLGKVTFLPISSYKTRELDMQYRPILRERGCLGVAANLINYDPRFETIMSGLLGSTVVCDNIDNAIAMARKFHYGVKIVTLLGEVLNTTGSMTGGSSHAAVSLLSQEERLKEYKQKLEIAKKDYDQTLSIFREKHEDYKELLSQLAEYESNINDANAKHVKENAIYEVLAQRCFANLATINEAKNKKQALQTKFDLITAALDKVKNENSQIQGSRTDIDDEARKTKEAFNKKKEDKSIVDKELQEISIKLSQLRAHLDGVKNSIEEKETHKKQIKESITQCKEVISQNDIIIKNTASKIDKTIMSEADKKRLSEISTIIKEFETKRDAINKQADDITTKQDADSRYMISLNDKKSKNESRLNGIDERMAALETRLLEDYDMDYEKALTYKVEDFDMDSAKSQISSLKGQRNLLGQVNFNAIDSYVVEKERFDELNKEYEDLLKAEEDCKQIIKTLSQEIMEKFTVEFNKINENFKVIFKELFGGGSGELKINAPEPGQDPLDTGIEIYAQPPGKTPALLMQLSGGEMALTAIAILFAILRLRPMPFCVLDEVDAALDEGNVGIYAKYLKKFSQETQFIVITHRKPTMRLSDSLYGVSMQERGVSRLFYASVDEAISFSQTKESK